MIGIGLSGDIIVNVVMVKSIVGIDLYVFKLLFGDWVYWFDIVNGVMCLVLL